MKAEENNRILLNNLMWLAASLLIAFLIWVIATLESNPIQTRTFSNINIEVRYDDALVITEQSLETVSVTVRAPQQTLQQLRSDDIQVVADLSGTGSGPHRVDLVPIISRQASADTSPRQINVTLEEQREKFVEVLTTISQPPPRGYEVSGVPILDTNQVLVSGPVSRVEEVTAARVDLDFSGDRNSVSGTDRLVAVDVEGNIVEDVMLEPAVVQVNVQIRARTDIKEVRVVPNVLYDTLPEGYVPSSITLDPDTVVITGAPELLESAPGAFFTEPIDLTGRTSTFDQSVGVQITDENLLIVGDQNITVTIGITALVSSRQFDRVPVEVIGLGSGLQAVPSPDAVTVLLTGPQLSLDLLDESNLRVVLDVNGLSEGNYRIMPDVSITGSQFDINTVSVLPAEIDVTISPSATAEVSPQADS